MKLGENIIAKSGLPAFFNVANPVQSGADLPALRLGDALRTSVRSFSGFQKEAIVASARTDMAWRLVSDEGPYLNGHDAAPCPLACLTAGMVAAYMNEITALAKAQHVKIGTLRLIQDNHYSMRGSMPRRTMVGGALPVELVAEIECGLDDARLGQLVMDAIAAAPLNGLLRGRHTSLFALARNGKELKLAKAECLSGTILPEPGAIFTDAAPQPGNLTLMEPVGLTPRKEVAGGTSGRGSSLADEQDRRLNIGAIATLREDGLKEIVQLQYSPHGTSFRFLSEEATQNGGQGRAPDANSLVSAGIGFCFMTQFGRFVSMLGLDLPDYRIVQDTHFSLGGASGGTGLAGAADPVETHVFLTTTEPDEVAREMLDISEQTCFLHALCRTDLKPRLKVIRV